MFLFVALRFDFTSGPWIHDECVSLKKQKCVFWDCWKILRCSAFSILPDLNFKLNAFGIGRWLWQDFCHIAKFSFAQNAVNAISRQRTPRSKVKKNFILSCFRFSTLRIFRPRNKINLHPQFAQRSCNATLYLVNKTKLHHEWDEDWMDFCRWKMFYNFGNCFLNESLIILFFNPLLLTT